MDYKIIGGLVALVVVVLAIVFVLNYLQTTKSAPSPSPQPAESGPGLGQVTEGYGELWGQLGDIACVSDPLGELVAKMQVAQDGLVTPTDPICMLAGETFTADSLLGKIANVDSLVFRCEDAVVCKTGTPITVTADKVTAVDTAKFRGSVYCEKNIADEYDCAITVLSV